MKRLLLIATILFMFGFANAQSKILSKDSGGYESSRYILGYYSNGKIH
jgi:hypothetical protein